MAKELISFDDLKVFLDLGKTESEYLDLTLIQESVVDALADYTRREFDFANHASSRFVYGKSKMIPLLGLPVKSVSEVAIDGVITDNFSIRPYGIELHNAVVASEVSVSYKGGLEKVPANLKRAALLQTVYEYQNKDSIGIKTTSTSGGSVTKPELGLLKEVKKLLHSEIHPYPVF